MRVLVALDKFKEALPAPDACRVVADTLRARHPDWVMDLCPLADGGDGFVRSLTTGKKHQARSTRVPGPLGTPVNAAWALVPAEEIPLPVRARLALGTAPLAIVEMAACSGLALVPRHERAPGRSTSAGVGALLTEAARSGAGAILLGVGGSATNDLGLGALDALGFRFLDAEGEPVAPPVPDAWPRITRIVSPPALALPPVWIACDVTNPLTGPAGATFVYGPQKGVVPDSLPVLDAGMERLGGLLARAMAVDPAILNTPAAGAAGGVAAGLMIGCGARLVGGFDLVAEWLDLERRVDAADMVITGEGGFDETSLQGKGPGGVVRLALARGIPVWVLAGRATLGAVPPGLRLVEITPRDMPLAEALPQTAGLLARAALWCAQ